MVTMASTRRATLALTCLSFLLLWPLSSNAATLHNRPSSLLERASQPPNIAAPRNLPRGYVDVVGEDGKSGKNGYENTPEGTTKSGLERFEKVTDYLEPGDRLFRSSAPFYRGEDTDQKITEDTITFLNENDIKLVISLNSQAKNEALQKDLATAKIEYLTLPVEDFQAPTEDDLIQGWKAFQRFRKGTLVWCGYGHGRTGVMVSSIQIRTQAKYDRPKRKMLSQADYKKNHVETPENWNGDEAAAPQIKLLNQYQAKAKELNKQEGIEEGDENKENKDRNCSTKRSLWGRAAGCEGDEKGKGGTKDESKEKSKDNPKNNPKGNPQDNAKNTPKDNPNFKDRPTEPQPPEKEGGNTPGPEEPEAKPISEGGLGDHPLIAEGIGYLQIAQFVTQVTDATNEQIKGKAPEEIGNDVLSGHLVEAIKKSAHVVKNIGEKTVPGLQELEDHTTKLKQDLDAIKDGSPSDKLTQAAKAYGRYVWKVDKTVLLNYVPGAPEIRSAWEEEKKNFENGKESDGESFGRIAGLVAEGSLKAVNNIFRDWIPGYKEAEDAVQSVAKKLVEDTSKGIKDGESPHKTMERFMTAGTDSLAGTVQRVMEDYNPAFKPLERLLGYKPIADQEKEDKENGNNSGGDKKKGDEGKDGKGERPPGVPEGYTWSHIDADGTVQGVRPIDEKKKPDIKDGKPPEAPSGFTWSNTGPDGTVYAVSPQPKGSKPWTRTGPDGTVYTTSPENKPPEAKGDTGTTGNSSSKNGKDDKKAGDTAAADADKKDGKKATRPPGRRPRPQPSKID